MSNLKIKIENRKVITEIIWKGKKYPTTQHNLNIIKDYKKNKQESVLRLLSDVTLDI